MTKSSKLMLNIGIIGISAILFMIINFTAWYLILNNYGVSLYTSMLWGFIAFSFIISLVFIAVLISYMFKINSLAKKFLPSNKKI